MNYTPAIRQESRKLRALGKSYLEIEAELGIVAPKSTISGWCRGVEVPKEYADKVAQIHLNSLKHARAARSVVWAEKRIERDENFRNLNVGMLSLLSTAAGSKLLLASLFWAEGAKNRRGSMLFGNSDPNMMRLYLFLIRSLYTTTESQFRVRIQCRADQDISDLEDFWSKVTGISRQYFYPSYVDARTLGKPTQKLDYKGVCSVDYFSADAYHEVMVMMKMLQGYIPEGH